MSWLDDLLAPAAGVYQPYTPRPMYGSPSRPGVLPPAMQDDSDRQLGMSFAVGHPEALNNASTQDAARIIAASLQAHRQLDAMAFARRYGIDARIHASPGTTYEPDGSARTDYPTPRAGESTQQQQFSMAAQHMKPYLPGEAEKEARLKAEALVRMRQQGITRLGKFDLNDPVQAAQAADMVVVNI